MLSTLIGRLGSTTMGTTTWASPTLSAHAGSTLTMLEGSFLPGSRSTSVMFGTALLWVRSLSYGTSTYSPGIPGYHNLYDILASRATEVYLHMFVRVVRRSGVHSACHSHLTSGHAQVTGRPNSVQLLQCLCSTHCGRRMPWPELPIDIIFTIAEFLRDDRKTLLACSLTNRAWLSASRSQLFHSIAITEWKTHIATFNDTLGSSLHIAGREYLQELHLVGISYTEERPQGSGKLAAVFHSFLDVAMMQSILEKLPALRQLHLFHLNLLSGTGCTPAPQGDRPRIDLLAVKGILSSSSSDNTFPALLDIVSLFSSIELLRLSVGHVDEAEEGMDTFGSVSNNPELNLAFRRPVTIGSLEWNATSHKVLAVVLNAIGKEPSAGLNSLSLTFGRSNRAVEVVASYLQLRGSSLHYLRIDPIYLCLSHQTGKSGVAR